MGRSAVAASAYRTGSILHDERTGLSHDYTKKGGVEHSQIYLPDNAPEHLRDAQTQHEQRRRLWNAAEEKENRSNSITSREFIVSLPHEFNAMQRREAGDFIARSIMERFGSGVEISYHAPTADNDERNFHAHVMYTARAFDDQRPDGWAKNRFRDMNLDAVTLEDGTKTTRNAQTIKELKALAAAEMNRIAERDGVEVQTQHLSYKEQGIDREPTEHLGYVATDMERKGKRTERGDRNREIQAINDNREKLKEAQNVKDLKAERERRNLPDVSLLASVRAHPHYAAYAASVEDRQAELLAAREKLESITITQRLMGKRREFLDEIEARKLNLADARQRLDDLTQSVQTQTQGESIEAMAARSKKQAETAAREAAEREKQAEQYQRNVKEVSALTDALASRSTAQRIMGAITGKSAEARSRIEQLREEIKTYEAQKRQEDVFQARRSREQVEDAQKKKEEQRSQDHVRSMERLKSANRSDSSPAASAADRAALGDGQHGEADKERKRFISEEERKRLKAEIDGAQAASDMAADDDMTPEEKRAASLERFNEWAENDKAEEQDNEPDSGLEYD